MKKTSTVLIIGGTSGIGLATAIRFSHDHNVIVVGRDHIKGSNVEKLHNVTFIQCDVSVLTQRKKLLQEIENKTIDKIVHSAGIFHQTENTEYQEEYQLVKRGGVDIISQLLITSPITHICATSSLYTFLPDTIVPIFEKSVQRNLEKAILSISGTVIANCVAPGLTNTPLVQKAYGEDGIQKVLALALGSRIVQPEEVAEAIYWLSTQRTITHSVIPIDGGFLRNLTIC